MTNIISALTARTQLGQIIKRASQKNERFVVGRRGEPRVIIMGLQDYIKTMAPSPRWLEQIWAESKRKGTDKLTVRQIDAEIGAYRRQQHQKKATKPRGK